MTLEDKRTVRFNEDRVVRDHDNRVVETFKAGKTYPLSPDSAERWVKRGVAEYTDIGKRQPKALTKAELAEQAAAGGQSEPAATAADASAQGGGDAADAT